MKILTILFLSMISIFANDDYFNFENEYISEKVEFENTRKLCFFEFRNKSENEKLSYLSKGLPSVLLSNLNGFQYIFDEDILINSISYEYGNPKNAKKISKSISRKTKDNLKNKKLSPDKDFRFIKLEIELIPTDTPPFRESILDLGRNKNCFYMVSGEFIISDIDKLDIIVELTNRKNKEVNYFSESSSILRAYQEMSSLTSKLKRKLFPKEMSSIHVDTGEVIDGLVFLDGVYLGKTPLDKNELPSGRHTLIIQKEGFEKIEKTIELKIESNSSYSFVFKALEKKSYISITSSPEKADVYLGNLYLGKTPINKVQVPSGQNKLKISKDEYIDFSKGLDLSVNEDFKFNINLKRGNTEEYYKTRLKLFDNYSYFDFSTYSLYSIVFFYVAYRYADARVVDQRDQIRALVPGIQYFTNFTSGNNVQEKYLLYRSYENIVLNNEKQVQVYQDYKHYSLIGMGSMLLLSGIFYYLGVDNDVFEFAYTPANFNGQTEALMKLNYRF